MHQNKRSVISNQARALRLLLPAIDAIENTTRAAELLRQAGSIIGLDAPFWASRLSGDQREDERLVHRALDWPPYLLNEHARRRYRLKSRVAARCRFELMPFVFERPVRTNDDFARLDRDQKTIMRWWLEEGGSNSVVIPVHLPFGRVAYVGWNGFALASDCEATVRDCNPELLAFGHRFVARMDSLHAAPPPAGADARLTPQEHLCLRHVAEGYRIAELADLLEISPTTARFHLDNARKKLKAGSLPHAVALGCQLGLLGSADG